LLDEYVTGELAEDARAHSRHVGGEGGTDYIHAAGDGRLYITRNAVRAVPATDSTPARDAVALSS